MNKLWLAIQKRVRFGWAEVVTLVLLLVVLRPAPAFIRQSWGQLKWDVTILRQLGDRIPEAHQDNLKYMYNIIEYVNASIPGDEQVLFVGEMKYAIRVHYYTFPRLFEWIDDESLYSTVGQRVREDGVDWLILNGARKANLSGLEEQLQLVYGEPHSHQRIYKVVDR
ncbi:MAG: hypothetical protein EOM20_18580 [Spartobacteria bacterium]|nr:hypothetical protein [Spartobacteria bacterium]